MNADVNAKKNNNGLTPYHMAALRGNMIMMRYLENKGVVDIKNI